MRLRHRHFVDQVPLTHLIRTAWFKAAASLGHLTADGDVCFVPEADMPDFDRLPW